MRGDALQLGAQHADDLRPFGNIDAAQLLHREAIRQVVTEIIEIIHAIGHHQRLEEGLRLHVFLDAGVQESNIRAAAHHFLAIQFQHQAQHSVRAGVLRPQVQHHGLPAGGAVAEEGLQLIHRALEFAHLIHIGFTPARNPCGGRFHAS